MSLPPSTTLSTTTSRSPRWWRRLRASSAAWIGAGVLVMLIFVALFAGFIAPYPPDATSTDVAAAPSSAHLLGTDSLRKDVLSRVMFGSRLSLLAGVVSILLAIALGSSIGALAGYFGGLVDALLMRGIDIALAFPSVLIALMVSAAYRPSWLTVVIAVGLINVPVFARQVRAEVMSIINLDYVMASRALGATNWQILTRSILPGLLSPVIVLASLSLGTAILEVAGLSFLGLGGDPTEPEWGSMLSQAKDYWSRNPWYAIAPGLAISITVLGFNLLGDGLRDALDPRTEV